LIVFIGTLFFFRYVGLSTITAFLSLFIFGYFSVGVSDSIFLIYLFLLFLFIVYTHRTNIASMLEKTEHKISFFK
jgi:glycerol-3-phosphate acyltransferase PlsY